MSMLTLFFLSLRTTFSIQIVPPVQQRILALKLVAFHRTEKGRCDDDAQKELVHGVNRENCRLLYLSFLIFSSESRNHRGEICGSVLLDYSSVRVCPEWERFFSMSPLENERSARSQRVRSRAPRGPNTVHSEPGRRLEGKSASHAKILGKCWSDVSRGRPWTESAWMHRVRHFRWHRRAANGAVSDGLVA